MIDMGEVETTLSFWMVENFLYERLLFIYIYIYTSVTDQCLWETPERPNYPKLETKVGIWQCGLGILVIMIVKIVTWHAEGS